MRNVSSCVVDKVYDILMIVILRLLYGLCLESNNSSGYWEILMIGKFWCVFEEGGVFDEG